MERSQPQILCAKEALDLLNCVTDPNFDQEKCIRLLNSLRNCVLQKVSEEKLISLLEQINNQTSKQTKVTIQRRRSVLEDDD